MVAAALGALVTLGNETAIGIRPRRGYETVRVDNRRGVAATVPISRTERLRIEYVGQIAGAVAAVTATAFDHRGFHPFLDDRGEVAGIVLVGQDVERGGGQRLVGRGAAQFRFRIGGSGVLVAADRNRNHARASRVALAHHRRQSSGESNRFTDEGEQVGGQRARADSRRGFETAGLSSGIVPGRAHRDQFELRVGRVGRDQRWGSRWRDEGAGAAVVSCRGYAHAQATDCSRVLHRGDITGAVYAGTRDCDVPRSAFALHDLFRERGHLRARPRIGRAARKRALQGGERQQSSGEDDHRDQYFDQRKAGRDRCGAERAPGEHPASHHGLIP